MYKRTYKNSPLYTNIELQVATAVVFLEDVLKEGNQENLPRSGEEYNDLVEDLLTVQGEVIKWEVGKTTSVSVDGENIRLEPAINYVREQALNQVLWHAENIQQAQEENKTPRFEAYVNDTNIEFVLATIPLYVEAGGQIVIAAENEDLKQQVEATLGAGYDKNLYSLTIDPDMVQNKVLALKKLYAIDQKLPVPEGSDGLRRVFSLPTNVMFDLAGIEEIDDNSFAQALLQALEKIHALSKNMDFNARCLELIHQMA